MRSGVGEMARLRAQGWTLEEIGARFGVSRQCVQTLLALAQRNAPAGPRPYCCQECGQEIIQLAGPRQHNGQAYCLGCLEQHPEATFRQRLKAFRMAAGLTQKQLGERAGVHGLTILSLERGASEPK